ncbi:MAG: class I SAM-dependent methyltransferase [Ignavibacteria bacterium]|nr:class I SAM-dependent methyltransferase [Ignavibacteria bacterium]
MDDKQIEIREQQKAAWNKFSAGWRKWDDLTMNFLKPMGAEIVRMIKPTGAEVVLDIASGTGEPGLTIAMALDGGHVVLTDLSEDMLTIAKENAERRGILNVETKACDVCELPFADNTFDAVSCRFGFMFFPDMELAAAEMMRVLKPGGRIATSVWSGPEKNFWVTAIGHTINRNMQLQPPPPGAPGMFRCAANGFIQSIFESVGFKNVSEQEVVTKLNAGTADVYWNMMTEVAAPFVAALSNADDAMRDNIEKEVYEQIAQKYPDGNVNIDGSALLIYGEK